MNVLSIILEILHVSSNQHVAQEDKITVFTVFDYCKTRTKKGTVAKNTIYKQTHPPTGYAHLLSTTPHGYNLPLTLLPPTSSKVVLPTIAIGIAS